MCVCVNTHCSQFHATPDKQRHRFRELRELQPEWATEHDPFTYLSATVSAAVAICLLHHRLQMHIVVAIVTFEFTEQFSVCLNLLSRSRVPCFLWACLLIDLTQLNSHERYIFICKVETRHSRIVFAYKIYIVVVETILYSVAGAIVATEKVLLTAASPRPRMCTVEHRIYAIR